MPWERGLALTVVCLVLYSVVRFGWLCYDMGRSVSCSMVRRGKIIDYEERRRDWQVLHVVVILGELR
jgi:hypothetical protein